MKTTSALLLTLLCILAGAASAQSGGVEVTPIVEGKAEPGKEWTLKIRFTVVEGFHAYHKDNPGGSLPILVKFSQLSGMAEVSQAWPEPKKHKSSIGEEWELEGKFDIAWKFKVPPDAKGKLAIAGTYEVQFCNDDGCQIAEGKFDTAVEVTGAASAEPVTPTATAQAAFEGPAAPGGKAVMAVTYTVTKGYHTYHKDNPGISGPTKVKINAGALKLVSETWPEAHKIDRFNLGKEDWEYEGQFTVKYTYQVPADAAGEIKVSGSFTGQVCDDNGCTPTQGEFAATLTVAKAAEKPPVNDAKDAHGFYVDFDYAMAEAKRLNKPLLVDFNGKFCAPCRMMEKTVFSLPEVLKLFDNFARVSLLTDVKDEKADVLWAKYMPQPGAGVPYYAVLDHDGNRVRGIGSTLPAEKKGLQFVAFLKGESIPDVKDIVKPENTGGTTTPPVDWPKDLPPPKPVDLNEVFDFEAVFSAPGLKPGAEVTLELRFEVKDSPFGPYRLYHPQSPHSLEMEGGLFHLKLASTGGLEAIGDWQYPKPKVLAANDPKNAFGKDEWEYFGAFTIVQLFRIPANTTDGQKFLVSGTLAGQYCNDQKCVWFTNVDANPFGWVATVAAATGGVGSTVVEPSHGAAKGEAAKPAPADGPAAAKSPVAQPAPAKSGLAADIEEKGGLFGFLLGVFGLGMLTLLTPCVLPVLPLTVAFFVKQADSGRSPLAAAAIYCGCIVATFTAFGLITSLLLGEQGAQIISTNPWVNIGIGVLFTVFALSFFGLFELRLPTFINSWISRKQMSAQKQGRGYVTALLSGGSFAVISFSCTGPIAASLLTAVATGAQGEDATGRWIPTLAMMVFALGLALPIFILGQFPNLLKRLPKSGGWMNAVKVVFAFIEIAVAVRYFSWAEIAFTEQVIPQWVNRNVVDAFWIACSVAAGLYLLGLFRMPHDHEKTEQLGVVRTMLALVFLSFGAYMLPGLVNGAPMGYLDGFLPPREPPQWKQALDEAQTRSSAGQETAHVEKWHQDLDEALAESAKNGRPVFIDFTGIICANCRWVETNIFPKPEVKALLAKDFVLCQQWTDKKGDQKAKDAYKKYGAGEKGVPMYVIVDSKGNVLEKFVPPTLINGITPAQFAEFMRRGKAKLSSGG